MGNAVLFILRFRLLLYLSGFGDYKVLVVLSGFSVRLFVLFRQKLYVGIVVCISYATLVLVCVDVMVISSAYAMT